MKQNKETVEKQAKQNAKALLKGASGDGAKQAPGAGAGGDLRTENDKLKKELAKAKKDAEAKAAAEKAKAAETAAAAAAAAAAPAAK